MPAAHEVEQYDVLFLGSGFGAKYLAWQLASEGKKCAVVERQWLGGSCPNVACLPSKNVIHSAKVAHHFSKAAEFGLPRSEGEVAADMSVVFQRKNAMTTMIRKANKSMFEQRGVEIVVGHGTFVGKKTITVKDAEGRERTLRGDILVICTGSRSILPEVLGVADAMPLTHVELLDLKTLPSQLIMLGAGYTTLEFAQAMRRFGSAVTIVARSARALPREDEDVSKTLQKVLEAEGIKFCMGAAMQSVSGRSGDKVVLKMRVGDQDLTIEGSHLYCGTGRVPNTGDIGLENTGVQLDKRGHIVVDEFCRASTTADVFAIGDCAGSPYFTHAGHDDFRIVRDYLSGKRTVGSRRSTRIVPFTLFTDPEFAHVGLREHEATMSGISHRTITMPMAGFTRAITIGETTGFAKALIADDDRILGFSAIGPNAGELLPTVQLAMEHNLPYTAIADLVISHPTLSEGLGALFGAHSVLSPPLVRAANR